MHVQFVHLHFLHVHAQMHLCNIAQKTGKSARDAHTPIGVCNRAMLVRRVHAVKLGFNDLVVSNFGGTRCLTSMLGLSFRRL